MYRNSPISIPTAIAVKRSVMTVSAVVASQAPAFLHESFTRRGISFQRLIVRTLDNRTAEITGRGIKGTRGVATKKSATTNTLTSIPAAGVWPPPRTLLDV